MKFERSKANPIIAVKAGTFYSGHAANPDVLLYKGKYHFYFRGGMNGHDQIGVAYMEPEKFDGIHWKMASENPIIPIGPNQGDFDAACVLDPGSVIFGGKVFLYYTAYASDGSPSIGLALSLDGTHFRKVPQNPILTKAYAPEVVFHENKIYLFYQRISHAGFFDVYCCISNDGINFARENELIVFSPSKQKGAFDEFSIATVRIWKQEDRFYMTYGGCDKELDAPIAFGLARSKDLFKWERFPANPIFTRGNPGAWDSHAIWFPEVQKIKGTYYLWYEGNNSICSQIGLATYHGEIGRW